MAQRDPIPEFGKWENDVRYTTYFERTVKADQTGSDTRLRASRVNAESTRLIRRTHHTVEDPTKVVRRTTGQDVQKATKGRYPTRTEQQTRADVGNQRRMANNPSHHHHGTTHRRVSTNRAESVYSIQTNSCRPRIGKGAGHPPPRPRERNNSTGSEASTDSMSPLVTGTSCLRPLAEGEKTPGHRAGIPKFGEWNKRPSKEQRFTEVFEILRDQKKTGSSSMSAIEFTETTSHKGERSESESDDNNRPKSWWPSCCSSW